jgi:hypothetical protein
MQNRLPGTAGSPHDGHPAKAAPQSPQNRAPAHTDAPHPPQATIRQSYADRRISPRNQPLTATVGTPKRSARCCILTDANPEPSSQSLSLDDGDAQRWCRCWYQEFIQA